MHDSDQTYVLSVKRKSESFC